MTQRTAVRANNIITLPPEIASTIIIKLLLNPVEATDPTIIPAVAIAVSYTHLTLPTKA